MSHSLLRSSSKRNGQKILPIVYAQPSSKAKRWLPLLVVGCCGLWIFALGTLIEHLPDNPSLPFLSDAAAGVDRGISLSYHDASTRILSEAFSSILSIGESGDTVRTQFDELNEESTSLQMMEKKTNDDLHSHRVPKILIFTHAINLLTYQLPPKNDLPANQTQDGLAKQEELLALQKNIRNIIKLNPHYRVRFLTDEDCIRSLQIVLGPNAPLISYFQREKQGMYKADICRGAALWETGGVYLDVDVGARIPFLDILQTNTTFATSLVHKDSNYLGSFFQAFMASAPQHAILERYLHLFLEYYEGHLSRPIAKGPLGVILLRQAFDDVVLDKPDEVQTIDLQNYESLKEKHFKLGPKILDTAHHGRIQLWQELLYHPKYMSDVVPAPTWGTRRACHFVVVANKKLPLLVPLYSRIEGSRMCAKQAKVEQN